MSARLELAAAMIMAQLMTHRDKSPGEAADMAVKGAKALEKRLEREEAESRPGRSSGRIEFEPSEENTESDRKPSEPDTGKETPGSKKASK